MKSLRLIAHKAIENALLDFSFMWSKGHTSPAKCCFIFQKYCLLISAVLLGGKKRTIRYFGTPFAYDNVWTPTLLQAYPIEIPRIGKYIDFSTVGTVLDVGANIGQFARTLTAFHPHVTTYSFEPNPDIYHLLSQNTSALSNCHTFNFGIGERPGKIDFFYVPDKSAQGSRFKENASLDLLKTETKTIQVDIKALDKQTRAEYELPDHVDLLKVDVEGAEESVLRGLRELDWTHLYMECSNDREGKMGLEHLKRMVLDIWGVAPAVCYVGAAHGRCYDVILRREPKSTKAG